MRLSLPRTALSVLQRQSRSSPSARSLLSTLGATAPAASAAPPAAEIKAPADISTDLVEATRRPNEVVAPYQVFSLMNQDGTLKDESESSFPSFSPDEWRAVYKKMIGLKSMDDVFLASQRQGRISFYMTSTGEEAIHIGSASALDPGDVVLAQYRETGVLLWRGATVQELADQCFSNEADKGKGRQMPVHYTSKEHNFQTISSPLTTQLPQAVGAAYGLKLDGKDNITCVYFGEGAASEGDFHAAMNIASTLDVPMLFFCRNNGYAISTPSHEQFRGDGIASRAYGYDMLAIRVDGNDVAAVHAATAEARRLAIAESRPVLVEAMTYRVSHHSTSDDSTRYRSVDEIKEAALLDPIERCFNYLQRNGWWSSEEDEELRKQERKNVLKALDVAERRDKPEVKHLFTDVYGGEQPEHLKRQEKELWDHFEKYPDAGGGH